MAGILFTGLAGYWYMNSRANSLTGDQPVTPQNPNKDWTNVFELFQGKNIMHQKYPDPSQFQKVSEINGRYGYVPKLPVWDVTAMPWNQTIGDTKRWPLNDPNIEAERKMMQWNKEVVNNGWGLQIFKNPLYTGDNNQFGPQQLYITPELPQINYTPKRPPTNALSQ